MTRHSTFVLAPLMAVALLNARLCGDGTQSTTVVVADCAKKVGSLKALRMVLQHDRHEATPKKGIVTMSGPGSVSARFEALMADGGRFVVRQFEGSQLIALVVCDGTTLCEYNAASATWTSYPAAWRTTRHLTRLLLIDDSTMQFLASCWVDDDGTSYAAWLRNTVGLWNTDPLAERQGNRRHWTFHVRQTRRQSVFTMDLVGRLTLDADSGLPVMAREEVTISTLLGGSVSHVTTTDVWAKCEPDPPVSIDAFTWNAPANAQRVDPVTLLPKKSPLVGKRAPEAVIRLTDGTQLPLSQFYEDRAVVLVFWATWCMPCKLELSELTALRNEFPEDKLAIIGVNIESSLAPVHAYLRKHPQTILIAVDPQGTLQQQYPGDSVPRTYIIHKGGQVADVWCGWGEGRIEALRMELRTLLH